MHQVIKYRDLIDDVELYDVILIGTNTYCTMNNGFQGKVRKKYNYVYDLNLSTKYGDKNKLGKRVTTKNTNPIFSLCFITAGYNFRPDLAKVYLDYDALENCLKTANNEFQGLRVATTMIGCEEFDGNGDRRKVVRMIKKYCDKIELYIYNYRQIKGKAERLDEFKKNSKICKGNPEVSKQIVAKQIEDRSKLDTFEEPVGSKIRIRKEIRNLLNRED